MARVKNHSSGAGEGYGEASLADDSIDFGELLQVFVRNKLLIAGTTLLVSALTLVWMSLRSPVYSAQAMLLLERNEAAGGVLSELASLGSDPQAAAETALLKTRSLAAVTVSAPEDWLPEPVLFNATEPDFDPFDFQGDSQGDAPADGAASSEGAPRADPSRMEQLGLETAVFPYDLRPMLGVWRRLTGQEQRQHRLYARLRDPEDADPAAERPRAFDVSFTKEPASGAIKVQVAPSRGLLSFGGEPPQTFVYSPEWDAQLGRMRPVALEAFGWRIDLLAVGEFVGQRYRVSRIPNQIAIKTLMANTAAVEAERKSNVIVVRMNHADPRMAAELANVLCKNYIRRSVRIKQKKATQTVAFIDDQLQEQLASLAEAEKQVVELQTLHPETISLSATAEAYVEQLTSLELENTKVDLTMFALREALSYLDAGDDEALARLGAEMPNLLALAYIRELGRLEAESLRLDRTDVLGYRQLLVQERLRLRGVLEETRTAVSFLERALSSLREGDTSGLALLGGKSSDGEKSGFEPYVEELARLDAELTRRRGNSTETNPLVRSLESARSELLAEVTSQVAETLEGMRDAILHYQGLIDDYGATVAAWPAEERETIDAAMASLRTRVRRNLQSQLDGLSADRGAIARKQEELEAKLGNLPRSEHVLAKPMREREALGLIVEFLLTSQQEARITAASTSAAAVLIDPATPPRNRQSPNITMTQTVGVVFGLMLGCVLSLLRNRMRGALYSESAVEQYAGLPVVGMVPDYRSGPTRSKSPKLGELFMPMRDEPDGPVAEAYRQIRASLRLAIDESQLRTLAVTSCVPREGKTVTNSDLAMVFAAAGKRVLLVDCDLRKPKVHKLFGLEREPGFATVVEKGEDWRNCVHATGVGSVDVLTAGRCRSGPGEILAGPDVVPLLDEMIAAYDLVVFDLPPAVVVGDVANFASKLDAMVLLYRCGGVPGRLLGAAANRLRRAGANLVGVIMNVVPAARASYGYGYGYGYGYTYKDDPDGDD